MGSMNVKDYLNRIGVKNVDLTPSLKLLQEVQQCHVNNVPWENLDPVTKVPIKLT